MNLNLRKRLRGIACLRKIKELIGKVLSRVTRGVNGLGAKRKCYICGTTFNKFTKFRGGTRNTLHFRRMLDSVGSDIDNYGCMYCGCNDRERHLFMYFDKFMLWERMKNGKILHFAPERHLQRKINQQAPLEYVKADLYPASRDIQKIDATEIPFADNTFDLLIGNHILEHIPDYHKALSEFYRVIKPGGIAILQTPYSRLLKNNFEDEGINSEELRLLYHGQEDHVRTFGEDQFLNSLEEAGFSLKIKKHADCFDRNDAYYFGVSMKEDLVMVEKPGMAGPQTRPDGLP